MSKHEVFKTITSDEFRVELQTLEDGPVLTVSGFAHDPDLTVSVCGPKNEQGTAKIGCVTLAHLFDLAERVKKAIGR